MQTANASCSSNYLTLLLFNKHCKYIWKKTGSVFLSNFLTCKLLCVEAPQEPWIPQTESNALRGAQQIPFLHLIFCLFLCLHFMSSIACQREALFDFYGVVQCLICFFFFEHVGSKIQFPLSCDFSSSASLRFPSQFLAVSLLEQDMSRSIAGERQAVSQTHAHTHTHVRTKTALVCETVISSCLGLQWPFFSFLKNPHSGP